MFFSYLSLENSLVSSDYKPFVEQGFVLNRLFYENFVKQTKNDLKLHIRNFAHLRFDLIIRT